MFLSFRGSAAAACTVFAGLSAPHPFQAPTHRYPVPLYTMDVRIAPDSSVLAVTGSVTIPAADSARTQVTLELSSMFSAPTFELVRPGQGELRVERDSGRTNTQWTLHPAQPFPAGVPVTVRFSYSAPTRTAYVFHIGPDGSFAGGTNTAWYPRVGGRPDSRGTGELAFAAPAGWTVVASGRRLASGVDRAPGRQRFAIDVPLSFSFAAGPFTSLRESGPVPITLYLLRDRPNAREYLNGVGQALPVLVREFGPYPFPEFSIVETPGDASQAAGFSGASFPGLMLATGPNLDKPFNLAFYAHEASHQWWANLINGRGDGMMMLTEGMAQYGSLRAVETIEGAAAAERYRRTGYPAYNAQQNARGYLQLAAAGLDRDPLLKMPGNSLGHDMADAKGFLVWDMLSRTLGPDVFRQALHAVTRDHAFESVSWETFVSAVQESSHRDLRSFFHQWMERTGAPEWKVSWRQVHDTVFGEVVQIGATPYQLNVEVRLSGDRPADSVTHLLALAGSAVRFHWKTGFPVRAIALDPHFKILHWDPDLAASARGIAPFTRAGYLDLTGSRDSAYALYRATLDSVAKPDSFGLRSLAEYGLAWMYFTDKRWSDAQSSMQAALRDADEVFPPPCRGPGGNCAIPWGHYLIARTAATLGDTTLACKAADEAIARDSAGAYGVTASVRAIGLACRP
jgi:peptidase M1-like protein